MIDNAPLQTAAWAELRAARRRLEKATRDLHRHEQIDEPKFHAWIGTAFAELITAVRELSLQAAAKARLVDAVRREAYASGRTPRAVWRAWQRGEHETPPAPARPGPEEPVDEDDDTPDHDRSESEIFEEVFAAFCARNGLDPDDPVAQRMRAQAARMSGIDPGPPPAPPVDHEARAIYRRLAQRLHPDRGGEWTPRRARLWHEVQAAWQARDGDMLARLEAEWEIAADTLGPKSAVGRLLAALAELHAARRDAERKVRAYRATPEWRFSLAPPDVRRQRALRRSLEEQRDFLRGELAQIEAVVARWERPEERRRRRRAAQAMTQGEFSFDQDGR